MPDILPAFEQANIPIVYASDDNFLACTAVSVASIIENASPGRNYDIILLYRGIAENRLAIFAEMARGRPNVSIRCFDLSGHLKDYDLYCGRRESFSEVTYYRLCIPWLLPGCGKAIYLDGDTLVTTDVAQLCDTDLQDDLLAAALDVCSNGALFMDGRERSYRRQVLKLQDPERYFNSGVLVMNLEAFRSRLTQEAVLKMAVSRDWKCHDQDILNSLCHESLRLLPLEWNYIPNILYVSVLPERYIEMYAQAGKAPFLVHYASDLKPWSMALPRIYSQFWEAAETTPFHGELVQKPKAYVFDLPENMPDNVQTLFTEGKLGFRYILLYMYGWLSYKLKRGRKDER